MSVEHINKAFKLNIGKSSLKFILVALADYANEVGEAYPSIETVCAKTDLNRKTVQAGLEQLQTLGFIQDTGKRVGRTQQVKVFQLRLDAGEQKGSQKRDALTKDPKNGMLKGSQKRDLEPSVSFNHQNISISRVSFDDFWQAYGNKKSKPTAQRAWKKLKPEQQKAALDAIPAFKASLPEWHELPYPASYLNQHRWEDDLTPAAKPEQEKQKSGLPRIDEDLPGWAAHNGLPQPRAGETYPQYRRRLQGLLERKAA